MSDESRNAGDAGFGASAVSVPPEQPFPDEHTTVPNAQPAEQDATAAARGKWQMPKPKFQQSSGYLPQGYLKSMNEAAASAKAVTGSEDTTAEQAAFVPEAPQGGAVPPAIEPQPDLSDQLIPEETPNESGTAAVPVKSSSSTAMVLLAVAGILIFVVVFLAAVYFLFIANQPASSNF